jgi:hypothetical protein
MKKELETIIMEQLKKGYCPAYVGEEGYIIITMKAYLAAAEYAGAEDICFWYDELYYGMIDVETKEDEIEGGHFTFMPRKEECKFKVGDIICPTPEADRYYDYTGSNMISAEVTEIKGWNLMEIRVKQHEEKTLVGKVFHVNPSYFELARNIKQISADNIFSDPEDIDLVYRAIDEKMSNLGGAIYYLKSFREDWNEIRGNEKLEDLSKELKRYEAILDRIVEYEKKQLEVKKDD